MKGNRKPDNRRISEMRNLGPACEGHLKAAGIHTAEDLIRLGEEAAFLKMVTARRRGDKSKNCVNAGYLYALYGAINDIDWRDVPESRKAYFKAFTAQLRESGIQNQ